MQLSEFSEQWENQKNSQGELWEMFFPTDQKTQVKREKHYISTHLKIQVKRGKIWHGNITIIFL